MTDHTMEYSQKKGSWIRNSLIIIGITIVAIVVAGLIAQRMSDGPTGPIPGGELVSGELVTGPVDDWSFATEAEVEMQLVEPMGSRITGIMVHQGQPYVTCDLGFLWARMSGRTRLILHTIYLFKQWHKDAVRDGRVVFRIDGKLYERQLVRVTEPDLLAALRSQVEALAREWIAPEPFGDAPNEGPRDIWFFRVDPRPPQLSVGSSISAGLFPRPM